MWGNEKYGIGIPAEVMAENVKRSHGIPEIASDLFRGVAVNKIGSESLINPLFWITGFGKEFAAFT